MKSILTSIASAINTIRGNPGTSSVPAVTTTNSGNPGTSSVPNDTGSQQNTTNKKKINLEQRIKHRYGISDQTARECAILMEEARQIYRKSKPMSGGNYDILSVVQAINNMTAVVAYRNIDKFDNNLLYATDSLIIKKIIKQFANVGKIVSYESVVKNKSKIVEIFDKDELEFSSQKIFLDHFTIIYCDLYGFCLDINSYGDNELIYVLSAYFSYDNQNFKFIYNDFIKFLMEK